MVGTTNNIEVWAKWVEGYDADTVAETIENLKGEGPHNIKVVGEISNVTVTAIAEALKANAPAKVNLDLSETTGLESFSTLSKNLCKWHF